MKFEFKEGTCGFFVWLGKLDFGRFRQTPMGWMFEPSRLFYSAEELKQIADKLRELNDA